MSLNVELREFLEAVPQSTSTRVEKALKICADPDVEILSPGDLVGVDADYLLKCITGGTGSISSGGLLCASGAVKGHARSCSCRLPVVLEEGD